MVKSKTPVMGYAAREIEWLMATYGMSFDHAVWEHPRYMTLILMPVYAERQGHKGMMSYTDLASFAARKEVNDYIDRNFTIVDAPPHTVGWKLGTPPAFLMAAQQAANQPVESRQAAVTHAVAPPVGGDSTSGDRTDHQSMNRGEENSDPGKEKHVTDKNDQMQPTTKPDDRQDR